MTPLNERQKKILDTAHKYFDEGDIEKAHPLLNALLSEEIANPLLHHLLGSIHYEKGAFRKALSHFKRALQINPDFTESAIGLSVILNDLGKYEEAQNVFLSAQQRLKTTAPQEKNLSHKIAEKHLELADLYEQNNQLLEALENIICYERTLGEKQDSILKKAQLLKKANKYTMATKIMREWASHQTVNAVFLAELAELYYLDQKPLAALSACEEALDLEPKDAKMLKFYARLKNTTFALKNPREEL